LQIHGRAFTTFGLLKTKELGMRVPLLVAATLLALLAPAAVRGGGGEAVSTRLS